MDNGEREINLDSKKVVEKIVNSTFLATDLGEGQSAGYSINPENPWYDQFNSLLANGVGDDFKNSLREAFKRLKEVTVGEIDLIVNTNIPGYLHLAIEVLSNPRIEQEKKILKRYVLSYWFLNDFNHESIDKILEKIGDEEEIPDELVEALLKVMMNHRDHQQGQDFNSIKRLLDGKTILAEIRNRVRIEESLKKCVFSLIELLKLRDTNYINNLTTKDTILLRIKESDLSEQHKQVREFMSLVEADIDMYVGNAICKGIGEEVPGLKLIYRDAMFYEGECIFGFYVRGIPGSTTEKNITQSKSEHYKNNSEDFLDQYFPRLFEINSKQNGNEVNIQVTNEDDYGYGFLEKLTDSDLRFLQEDLKRLLENEFKLIIQAVNIKRLEDGTFRFEIKVSGKSEVSPVPVVTQPVAQPTAAATPENTDQTKFKQLINAFLYSVGVLLNRKLQDTSLGEGVSVIELIMQDNARVFNFLKENIRFKDEIIVLLKNNLEGSINGLKVAVDLKNPAGTQWDPETYEINIVIKETAQTVKLKQTLESELIKLKPEIEKVGEKNIDLGTYSRLKNETIRAIVANIFFDEDWIVEYRGMQTDYIDALKGETSGTLVIISKKYQEGRTTELLQQQATLRQMIGAQSENFDQKTLERLIKLFKNIISVSDLSLEKVFFNPAKIARYGDALYTQLRVTFAEVGIGKDELKNFVVPVLGKLIKWANDEITSKTGEYIEFTSYALKADEIYKDGAFKESLRSKLTSNFGFSESIVFDSMIQNLIMIICALHTDFNSENRHIDTKLNALLIGLTK